MTAVAEPAYASSDSDLAAQVAKLWPHQECEANIVLGQFCRIGLHRGIGWICRNLFPAKTSTFPGLGCWRPKQRV